MDKQLYDHLNNELHKPKIINWVKYSEDDVGHEALTYNASSVFLHGVAKEIENEAKRIDRDDDK